MTTISDVPYWKNVNGAEVYVAGKAGYGFFVPLNNKQMPTNATCASSWATRPGTNQQVLVGYECTLNRDGATSIPVLNGADLQDVIAKTQTDSTHTGSVSLMITDSVDDSSADVAFFPVQVTSSQVSSAGSSVSRKLATFTNFKAKVTALENKLIGANTDSTTTGTFPFGENTSVTPLNAGITKDCSEFRNDFKNIIHNGNPNVYACNGVLEITNDITMDGVKTVLVQGNIIFKANTKYSSDNNASWAFIAKGGDIQVGTNVKNLAGVYLSVKETTNGGKITPTKTGANYDTTAEILRVDGSLYGDASELFKGRTYARGTSTYDMLTAGTVLNYSNRALRNPPPLLSNYLNHYKVQRVVR